MMIKVHRRWWLPAIVGCVVLLVAGIGLFLLLRPPVPAATPHVNPTSHPTPQPTPSTTPSPTETDLQWSNWEDLGGSYTSAPAVASWGVHRLDVFAQAAGQTMLHQTYDGKFWYPADDLGPAIVGSPGAVAWGPDRLDVFVRGTDNQLWQMAYAGGGWVGYYPLGGSLTSSPAVASWGRTGSMSS